jgi:pyrimidine operon attenuation protein/uracil phosphoribosyltransferase
MALYELAPKPYATNMTEAQGSRTLFSHDDVRRVVARLAHEIDDRLRADERGPLGLERKRVAVVGIRTGGAHLAHRLAAELEPLIGHLPDVGILDITLYRDDVLASGASALLKGTDIDFDIDGRPVILVDDVLFTGRTIRAALDALLDLGRPGCVRLAVLVDRGLRELPIAADFVGRTIETTRGERVKVELVEEGHAVDEVKVVLKSDRRRS